MPCGIMFVTHVAVCTSVYVFLRISRVSPCVVLCETPCLYVGSDCTIHAVWNHVWYPCGRVYFCVCLLACLMRVSMCVFMRNSMSSCWDLLCNSCRVEICFMCSVFIYDARSASVSYWWDQLIKLWDRNSVCSCLSNLWLETFESLQESKCCFEIWMFSCVSSNLSWIHDVFDVELSQVCFTTERFVHVILQESIIRYRSLMDTLCCWNYVRSC